MIIVTSIPPPPRGTMATGDNRAEGALRKTATTPVGPARLSLYGWRIATFHACAVILQTHVEVPDRPSNRGVFPGGPEVQEILIGSRGPCPGGT